jgi:acyl transferase domain-containing protein/acyl carrier protein
MGRELYDTQPVFRKNLDRCNEILRAYLKKPLLEVIYPEVNVSGDLLLNETAYTQPALFALEYSLAELWKSWGIKPHAVMGHSVGEYAAACVAGVFSLEDGLKLIAERGRMMQSLPRNGEMTSVQTNEERVISAIAKHTDDVSVAAMNGPRSIVISGKSETVRRISDMLKNEGVKVKKLEVSHAFHSPLMEPMLADFEKTLNSVSFHAPRIALVSNLTGDFAGSDMASAEYWLKHVRRPVRFSDSMENLHRKGYEVFMEIGPKPVLLGMGRLCLPKDAGLWLPGLRPNRSDWQQLLESLAELYVRGAEVDWRGFDQDYSREKVHLPTYPFQRQKYWIESAFSEKRRQRSSHPEPRTPNPEPLNRLNLPFSQEIRFESRIAFDSPPHLKDHQIFGTVVMPAASHISLVLSGVRQAFHTDACVIEELFFSRAITLSEDETRTLQLILTPCDKEAFSFQIASVQNDAARDNTDAWTLHSNGKVRVLSEVSSLQVRNAQDVKARCAEAVSGSQFYADIQASGYVWGPSFQWTEKVWRSKEEALCRIVQPSQLPDEIKDYQLYPGLLDAAFQLLGSFGKEVRGEKHEVRGEPLTPHPEPLTYYSYMPFRIENFKFYRRPEPGRRLWSHVRLEDSQPPNQSLLIGNLSVFDDAGQVIAEVKGFEFRRTSRESLLQAIRKDSDCFYEVSWKPKARTSHPEPLTPHPGTWLIFADQKGLGAALAERLKAHGESCVTVFTGQNYETFDKEHYYINPAEPKDFQRLAQECRGVFKGIVHLWSLDETESSSLSLKSAICTVQAGWAEIPRLCLVTRGAQPVGEKPAPLNVHQSPLWGLGQVIALEHPDFYCLRLDLDPSAPLQDEVNVLLEEIWNPDEEPQIALREGIRYVARLVKKSLPPSKRDICRPDGSYLITGGTGALGLKVASQLVKNGARHLVLMSRRGVSDKAREAIAQMEQRGAAIVIVKADVSIFKETAEVFEKIKSSMPQLRGIVHAAGVLNDGVLIQQNWARFQKVLAPKAAGAWHLHNLTLDMPLDFFVCFSSIASLLGSPAQGNYAAANAFLDALAHHRRAMGLPGLSINWGPWEQSGMAAGVSHRDQSRWKSRGVETLPPEKGLEILEQLLGQDIARVGVFRVNWSEFLKQFSDDRLPLFLEAFSQSYKISDKQAEQQSEFFRQLESLSLKSRREFVAKHIRSRIARVLGLTSSENIESRQSLFEIGMDSLMAVELKNSLETELGRPLRSTLVFDYPTIEALADYLISSVLSTDESSTAAKEDEKAKDIQSEILSEIEQLSEDKLEAAIDDELNALISRRN